MALLLKASRVITPIVLCLRFTYKMLKLNKIEIKDNDFSLSLNDFSLYLKILSLESYISLNDFIVRIVEFYR